MLIQNDRFIKKKLVLKIKIFDHNFEQNLTR